MAALTDTNPSLWRSSITSRSVGSPRGVRRVQQFDAAAGDVWDRVWGGRGAGTRRSAAFLNWRYASHPTFRYRMFRAGTQDSPAGFAVYRVEEVRGLQVRVGRLIEFVADPGAEDALLDGLLEDACREDTSVVDFFCTSAHPAAALARRGWLPDTALPAEMPVLLQPINRGRRSIPFLAHLGTTRAPQAPTDWYVTKGDGDQDRPN
jgi:hypothetical protein